MKKIYLFTVLLSVVNALPNQEEELTQIIPDSEQELSKVALSSLGRFSFCDNPCLQDNQREFIEKLKRMMNFKFLKNSRTQTVLYFPHSPYSSIPFTEYRGEGCFVIDSTHVDYNPLIISGYLDNLGRQQRTLTNKSDLRLVDSALSIMYLLDARQTKGFVQDPLRSLNEYQMNYMERNVAVVVAHAYRRAANVMGNYSHYNSIEQFLTKLAHPEFKKYQAFAYAWPTRFSSSFYKHIESMERVEEEITKKAVKYFKEPRKRCL